MSKDSKSASARTQSAELSTHELDAVQGGRPIYKADKKIRKKY